MVQRAPLKQYYLEIGSYFLKKGSGVELGQILKAKRLEKNRFKVKVITGLFYDFNQNKINHTAENRVIKKKHEKKG